MATTSGLAAIGSEQFLQLLVAQLQNQDPLDPVSDKDFIGQIATLNSVQGLQDLNASFAEMLKLQQLTQGVDLIGKTIKYTPDDGSEVRSGKVSAVSTQDGSFVLDIGTDKVGLSQIQSVVS